MSELLRATELAYGRSDNRAAMGFLVQATARTLIRLPLKQRLSYLRHLIDGMFEGFEVALAKTAAARRKQNKKRTAPRPPRAPGLVVH